MRRSERLERKKQQIFNGTYRPQEPTVDVESIDADEYNAEELEQIEEELLDAATAAETIQELDAELIELGELIRVAKRVRDSGTDRKWTELSTILQDNALITDADGVPKFIVFTEHRDTLDYLTGKIRSLLGRPAAVQAIHGGVRRRERRQITEEFTKSRDFQILIATDAAGEGLNLQAAHLMVNYDLPWNPNRIEQRFGRIHRIGQDEVCRLWNIIARNTREGEVFARLLDKIEEQRKAYGGKVFDVLGEAFSDRPLRELLLEAIRYGDLPAVRARMHEVIDAQVAEGLQELLEHRALASDHFAEADLAALRAAMDEARTRRLQPHYIELAFKAALTRLGGRIAKREKGRYEIANVPAHVRAGKHRPIATKYERVTFDLAQFQPDGLGAATTAARQLPWLGKAEDKANSWIIAHLLPEYLADVQPRRVAELAKTRRLVARRLEGERDRLILDAAVAAEKGRAGEKAKESADSLSRKAVELDRRLRDRLELLDQQELMSTKPPLILTAALVLPLNDIEAQVPERAAMHAKETKEVERRGVDLVLARERELGRRPVEQPFTNKGFDILSTAANGDTYRIEVKARIEGAKDFFVTHNEVMTGKNAVPRYRLALVRVDQRGAAHDQVRYLDNPFALVDLGDFDATGIRGDWGKLWAKGSAPF